MQLEQGPCGEIGCRSFPGCWFMVQEILHVYDYITYCTYILLRAWLLSCWFLLSTGPNDKDVEAEIQMDGPA